MNRALIPLCAAGLLLAALPMTAPAQTAPRTSSLGSGSGTGPVMSKEELRACLKQQAALAEMGPAFDAKTAQLASDREALNADVKALEGELEQVKAASARIEAMNQRASELAARITEWNTRWAAFIDANRTGPMAERERRRLTKEQDELEKEKVAMEAERAQVASARPDAEAINARLQQVNDRTAEWNERNRALVDEGARITRERELWASECGNRRYREDDEIAIKQGK